MLYISTPSWSQVIPIDGVNEYCAAHNIVRVPDGSYLKDVNGLFDRYIGDWEITHNNRNYKFYINKDVHTFRDRSGIRTDFMYITYLVTEQDGTIVADTRLEQSFSIYGLEFIENYTTYIFGYKGERSECGNDGDIYLSYIEPTPSNPAPRIQLDLIHGGTLLTYREDCQDFNFNNDVTLAPMKYDSFILTAQ